MASHGATNVVVRPGKRAVGEPINIIKKLNKVWDFEPFSGITKRRFSSSMPELRLDSLEMSSNSTAMEYPSSQNSISSDEDFRDTSLLLETSTDSETSTDISFETSNHCEQYCTTTDASFTTLRLTYLLVTLVIMLADGLQGTHLYVLYESYGYSVASLYCLGFMTGGLLSPITGPLVDKIGRKKAAILYCALEMFINGLEQYPMLIGLIASRMIGGFTTNLLSSVFETWLDTEYRRRGLEKHKYEIIMRDAVMVSNAAAIFSGYLAHILAESYGNVGPFRGAVTCTAIALAVVAAVWNENYGNKDGDESKDMSGYFHEAVSAFRSDSKMLRVGIIQGLSMGSVQIFIFLWAPALRELATSASSSTWGLDSQGAPAYGLIFGSYMAAGVFGGLLAPMIRQSLSSMLSPFGDDEISVEIVEVDGEELQVRPMAVEFLAAFCYFFSSLLLLVPCVFTGNDERSFAICFAAFLLYEILIGIFMPCEGVIRSLYFPASARASVMSLPRILVNFAVALGVVSTNYVSLRTAFSAVAALMVISTGLQLSLLSKKDFSCLVSRILPLAPMRYASRLACRSIRPMWKTLTAITDFGRRASQDAGSGYVKMKSQ